MRSGIIVNIRSTVDEVEIHAGSLNDYVVGSDNRP